MRTTTITTAAGFPMTIGYPNSTAFMYSPQLVQVTGGAPDSARATISLTHLATGRQYTEERAFFNGAVRFDISRAMQLLAPDIDSLFHRLDYDKGNNLTEGFGLQVNYVDLEQSSYSVPLLNIDDIIAMYGVLDQGEIYGKHTQRRLWLNFPQTFNIWTDEFGEAAFVIDDTYVRPDNYDNGQCYECDLLRALAAAGDEGHLASILPGRAMQNVKLTWRNRIEKGSEAPQKFKTLTLVPEDSKEGTYLRWLNRRGEVSYWLFENSQIRITSAVNNNFERFYENDPSEPDGSLYSNRRKSDYKEVQELVIGATGLSYDEFEDLCDLATSPLIDRLMPGTSDTWQRVNVAAGKYARSIKRVTPNLQDLEFIIELPERNTIRL